MNDADREYLLENLEKYHVPIVTKKYHTYLTYQGDTSDCVYILKEGVAKVSSILRDGREFNITYITDSDFVSLLDEKRGNDIFSVFNVRIETEFAEFYQVSRRDFWQWSRTDNHFFEIVDDFYRRRLAFNIDMFQQMMVNGKKGAVCSCIHNLIDSFGIQKRDGILIDFPITNEDIAGFCGISTRNSVSRIVHDLEKEHVLSRIDGKIMIYNLSFLEDYIN